MRIRKAEKLLGFTSDNRTAPPPPTPWDSTAAILSAAGLLCQINRSCSVNDLINLQPSSHPKYELEIANDKEDETAVAGKSSDDKEEDEEQEEKEVEAGEADRRRMQYKLKELSSYRELLGESMSGNQRSVLDDESDREALAEGFNGVEHEGVDGGNLCNFNYRKKRRPLKKRGRKPVKARSLKSLLSF